MPSTAFSALAVAVREVEHLLELLPSTGPIRSRLSRGRAVGRAGVVLLSSHFERYVYALNEEAVSVLNAHGIVSDAVPETLGLLHSARVIDDLVETEWTHRAAQLRSFASDEAWLWIPGGRGTLKFDRLLVWMKSPKPEALIRYFSYWGIDDVFDAVTRTKNTRQRMALLVSELVDKRNNIAHGDTSAFATKIDVRRYSNTVLTFCRRADKCLARAMMRTFAVRPLW